MIKMKLLPESFKNYRQRLIGVFDIETLQTSIENDANTSLVYEAIQIPVSIGFDSNIPGVEPKFFVRSSSDPDDGYKMVQKYVDYLQFAQQEFIKHIPHEILEAKEKLSLMMKQPFSKKKTKLQTFQKLLKRFTQLNIFGYNSSRFDIPGINNFQPKDSYQKQTNNLNKN